MTADDNPANQFAAKYDHANLATKLQRGAVINYFIYGPNNAKARQTGSDGSKVYLGGYEDWITAGQTKVSLGNYAQITNGTGGRVLHYFLTDRLGSVDAVTDGNGNLIETRGYDAFGAPRTGVWADASQIASTAITPKGFTSHEHLNSVKLIHMNGRMYDFELGRFLGVDPFIQAPTNSQSMNPYSYIMNNPLSGTDPTGYAICYDFDHAVGGCSIALQSPRKQLKQDVSDGMYGDNAHTLGQANVARAILFQEEIRNRNGNGSRGQGESQSPSDFGFSLKNNNNSASNNSVLGRLKDGLDWLNSTAKKDEDNACFPHGCSKEEMRKIKSDDRKRQDLNRILAAIPVLGEEALAARTSVALRGPAAEFVGISADEIVSINIKYSNGNQMNGNVETILANMEYRASFSEKAGSVIRDIAGRHLFENGNKRTAQSVVEALAKRNGVNVSSSRLRKVTNEVGEGKLRSVEDISKALRIKE